MKIDKCGTKQRYYKTDQIHRQMEVETERSKQQMKEMTNTFENKMKEHKPDE
jgi:hypothetical protein